MHVDVENAHPGYRVDHRRPTDTNGKRGQPYLHARSPLVSSSRRVLLVLLAGLVATSASRAAPAPTTEEAIAPYLTPQRAVPVEKGRTINLVCRGQGSPTVILSAGLGGWSFDWGLVQPALAKRTRVCAWDRAGYGFSSPSPEPQDILHTVSDLERALQGAGGLS